MEQKIAELTGVKKMYSEFWDNFNKIAEGNFEFRSNFTRYQFKSIRNYQNFSVDKPYYNLVVKLLPKKDCYCLMAYISKPSFFKSIYNNYREQIENEVGHTIEWNEYSVKSSATLMFPANFDNRTEWDRMCNDMISYFLKLRKAFAKYSINY